MPRPAPVTAMVLPSRYPTMTPLSMRAVKLAEQGVDELPFEVGEPGVRRDDRGVRGVRVELGEVGVVGDADAGPEGEARVVQDAEPRLDVVGSEGDDDPVPAGRLGTLEGGGEPFEGREAAPEQLGVDEVLPLLLGLLLGGVEVGAGEEPGAGRGGGVALVEGAPGGGGEPGPRGRGAL